MEGFLHSTLCLLSPGGQPAGSPLSSPEGARLSWERGHPGPPRQGQLLHCLWHVASVAGEGSVAGRGHPLGSGPCTQQELQGKRCACSPLASTSGGWAGEGGSLLSLLWLQVSG